MINKTRVKIGIVVVITCVMCFSDWGFAVDESKIWSIAWLENFVINVLSWGWVLLAKLAGEFLTNKWVYGEMLGLDALFWQYWNVTKNIANFCLGFYFIYIIFRGLIDQGKESIANVIKNKILWILIAGVGIQISWFFTAAMVDVSTITLVAAGSLPAQVISSNERVKWSYENSLADFFDAESQSIMYGKYMTLFDTDSKLGKFIKVSQVPLKEPVDQKSFFDSLTPTSDAVSGPLYSMGFAILNAHVVPSIDSSSVQSLKGSMLNLIIMGGTTVVYALEMLVLCVLALMRIIYLWMFIILSPLAIFLRCLQMAKDDEVLKWSFVETITKQINLKSFFINIFKPTIIVIGISLATIFASLMKGELIKNGNKPIDLESVMIQTEQTSTENTKEDKSYTSTMNAGIIKFTISNVGKGLLDMVISIITVILVYVIISFAVNIGEGKDFVSEKLKKVQQTAGGLVTSLPVMPVTGYDEEGVETTRYMTMGQVLGVNKDMKSNGSGGLLGAKIGQYQGKVKEEYSRQDEIVRSWFGDETKSLTAEDIQKIGSAMNTGNKSIDKLINAKNAIDKDEKGKGMKLNRQTASNDGRWINQFEKWLESAEGLTDDNNNGIYWEKMKNAWDSLGEKKSVEKLFNNNNNKNLIKTYVNFFGLNNSIDSWEELKEADISKK